MSDIKVYRDGDANAVVIEGTLIGMKFNNEIQAVGNLDGTINLKNLPKIVGAVDFDECTDIPYAEFVDISDVQIGSTEAETVNNLNAIFQVTGTGASNIPVITSSLVVAMTQGDSLDYILEGDFGSEVIWDFSNVTGMTSKNGNNFNILGGSGLGVASYNVPVILLNSNGQDSETIVITVSSPPYNNTKSVKFNNNDFCSAASTTSNPFYRASNGSGSGDAWSVSVWFKGGTSSDGNQTIMSFGGNNKDNEGRVWIYWDGNSSKEFLVLKYGSENEWLKFETPDNSVDDNTWYHFLITYDGGTTGSSGASINDYYGRFEIWIDGVSQTLTKTNSNDGWDSSIKDELFNIGEVTYGGKHMRNNCHVDEPAIWSTDETANVAAIYNSGTPHDLVLLGSASTHYWRMGDGDTYPTLQDAISTLDFTMNNMTVADIVNDVP